MTGCRDTEARTRLERPPLPASRPDSSGCTEGQQVIIGWLVELDQRPEQTGSGGVSLVGHLLA